jgi:hypothetical protein
MLVRTQECFDIQPQWLVGDTAYGSAPNLDWLVNTQGIAPRVPIIDKSQREDGTFSRENFIYDEARDCYVCPAGKSLTTTGHIRDGHLLAYLARVHDCRGCPLKPNCCPKTPQRKVLRSIYEPARDVARTLANTEAFAQSRRDRKKVEMLFAHLKRILRLNRLPCEARAALSSSSRWQPSLRTCAGSPSLWPARRQLHPSRALRERHARLVEPAQPPAIRGRYRRPLPKAQPKCATPPNATSATKSVRLGRDSRRSLHGSPRGKRTWGRPAEVRAASARPRVFR